MARDRGRPAPRRAGVVDGQSQKVSGIFFIILEDGPALLPAQPGVAQGAGRRFRTKCGGASRQG